jgi:hypothetical protein
MDPDELKKRISQRFKREQGDVEMLDIISLF